MAIAVIGFSPGGSAEQDMSVMRLLNLAANPAPGAMARMAGPRAGGWQVISVWETQEAFESFQRDRLEPAMRQAGVPVPQFEIWPLQALRLSPPQS